ncbi:hypothetical protein JR316_0013142 [Psilocybe cubensis]|uniref:F-box domain-containing protein n=2 Tax=Psilocybe cubensis TaxID=181762 RepID=A0A8H7XRN1_PSICU|nr:hypothetical protein JR316_0013142 [Psilocybe cubensis]KAH9474678.1 hypothetical protein JR316_0013142 [Psilocybe cubensis]
MPTKSAKRQLSPSQQAGDSAGIATSATQESADLPDHVPKRKKRKVDQKRSATQASDAKTVKVPQKRGRRATAKGTRTSKSKARVVPVTYAPASLQGMPTELLILIFGQVYPKDLLQLMWTSKVFRTILRSKGASGIWKKSRSRIRGMPQCPSDLSEPQYASLLFGHHCYICFNERSIVYESYAGRFKACFQCLSNEKLFVRSHLPDISTWWDGPYQKKLALHLPQLTIADPQLLDGQKYTYWPLAVHQTWSKEHSKVQHNVNERAKWANAKIAEIEPIEMHARECENWIAAKLPKLGADRLLCILDYLDTLGWEDELEKLVDPCETIMDIPGIYDACQTKITSEVLARLEPRLVRRMVELKNKRLRKQRLIRLKQGIPLLRQVIQDIKQELPLDVKTPDVADIFLHPIVQKIWKDTMPKPFEISNFDPGVESKLINEILSAIGQDSFDRTKVLHLATTIFTCEHCVGINYYQKDQGHHHFLLQYPRVLVHEHATNEPKKRLRKTTAKICWGTLDNIKFWKDGWEVLSDLLTEFGYDPQTTTAAEMDAADPIFHCVSCNSPRQGRATMRWRMVPRHKLSYQRHINHPPCKLELLGEREAQIVRERLDEANALYQASTTHGMKSITCVHCRTVADSVTVKQHIKEKHGIDKPTKGDMFQNLDCSANIAFHFLWPPLD